MIIRQIFNICRCTSIQMKHMRPQISHHRTSSKPLQTYHLPASQWWRVYYKRHSRSLACGERNKTKHLVHSEAPNEFALLHPLPTASVPVSYKVHCFYIRSGDTTKKSFKPVWRCPYHLTPWKHMSHPVLSMLLTNLCHRSSRTTTISTSMIGTPC